MKYLILSFIFCISLPAEETFIAFVTVSKNVSRCDENYEELYVRAESSADRNAMRNCKTRSVERLGPFAYDGFCGWGQPFSRSLTARAKFVGIE